MSWAATGVADSSVRPAAPVEVMLEGRSVLLARVDTALVALDGYCPHEGGVLRDGEIRGHRIACPVHGAEFDLRSGHVLADPFGVSPPRGGVAPLGTFRVRVRAGMVEVDLSVRPAP